MDDVLPDCKKKMARFRIQELKYVLSQLGLAKTGRKQDLMERILALLSDEEASNIHGQQKNNLIRKDDVAKIIDDTYRKMTNACANDPVPASTRKEEIVEEKIRCPCGSPRQTELLIQCVDPQCRVMQHVSCVIIPVESTEEVPLPPFPYQHYCELCRINRSDPFWQTLAHPLFPVKLLVSSIPDDGSQPVQNVETSFQITKGNIHLMKNSGYDVQAWCILLNDSVSFRMQWPQYPDLKVNGIPVKTINRPGSKMLGANGRDDGPSISLFLVEGCNKISLSCSDVRTFCLGVRLVKQRTFQQVINLISSEEEGESFTEAVARVCRCIGGGTSAATNDSDSDLEVIADNITINLRCPMSGCRMKTAARFKGCIHLGCFDLHTFVEINQRSRKWQCPICLKNYSVDDIIIDPYLNRIVKMMQPCDEDVTEIEVKSDGSWRTKIGRPFMDLERWHFPDGSFCSSEVNLDSNMEVCTNGQGVSELEEFLTNYGQEIISMSSGSSENMNEDGQSVDHHGTKKDIVMDYMASGITNRSSSSLGDPSVIVLSDSDSEENNNMVSTTGGSKPDPSNGGFGSIAANPETPDMELGDAVFPAAECSQMSNSKGFGDPFTFPRQPRTVRRPNATKYVQRD